MVDLLSPGVSGLPVVVEWFAGGIGLAGAAFWGRIKFLQGKRDVTSPAVGEIAGAIISNDKANEIVAAIDRQTVAVVELVAVLRANTRAMATLSARTDDNTIAARAMFDKIGEASTDIRELTRELVRSSRA